MNSDVTYSATPVIEMVALLLGIPLLAVGIIVFAILGPQWNRAGRWRPGEPWNDEPMWFGDGDAEDFTRPALPAPEAAQAAAITSGDDSFSSGVFASRDDPFNGELLSPDGPFEDSVDASDPAGPEAAGTAGTTSAAGETGEAGKSGGAAGSELVLGGASGTW